MQYEVVPLKCYYWCQMDVLGFRWRYTLQRILSLSWKKLKKYLVMYHFLLTSLHSVFFLVVLGLWFGKEILSKGLLYGKCAWRYIFFQLPVEFALIWLVLDILGKYLLMLGWRCWSKEPQWGGKTQAGLDCCQKQYSHITVAFCTD